MFFTRVCHSVHMGGGIPACTTGHVTKHYISNCTGDQSQLATGQAPPWAGTPPGQAPTSPWADSPSPRIWSMSGPYASYWNAFFLCMHEVLVRLFSPILGLEPRVIAHYFFTSTKEIVMMMTDISYFSDNFNSEVDLVPKM